MATFTLTSSAMPTARTTHPTRRYPQFAEVFNRPDPPEQAHRSVDEQTETERNGNLKQVDPQVAAQIAAGHEEEFQKDEPYIENDGPLAHRQRREEAQDIGDTGDGRRAKHRAGDEGNAQGVDEQRNDEQQITAEEMYVHVQASFGGSKDRAIFTILRREKTTRIRQKRNNN